MESKTIISNNLKKYRTRDNKKKISQEKLAAKAEISTRGYGKIERAEVNVCIDSLEKLAAAMGITVSQLLDENLDFSKLKKEE